MKLKRNKDETFSRRYKTVWLEPIKKKETLVKEMSLIRYCESWNEHFILCFYRLTNKKEYLNKQYLIFPQIRVQIVWHYLYRNTPNHVALWHHGVMWKYILKKTLNLCATYRRKQMHFLIPGKDEKETARIYAFERNLQRNKNPFSPKHSNLRVVSLSVNLKIMTVWSMKFWKC